MVWVVSKKTDIKAAKTAGKPHKSRLPKAAVDYIDALLEIQQHRFERETAITQAIPPTDETNLRSHISHPKSAHFLAEGDNFTGTGWSEIGHRRDGTAFRWMARLGTLLLPLDLTAGGSITINGCGYTKKKFLTDLTVWIDDQPVEGDMARKGFNRWIFTGSLPPLKWRPYSILKIQSAGLARLAVGVDRFSSVAVSDIRIDAG